MSGPLVAIIISTVIGPFVGWIALDIITARKDAKDMREQIEEFYKTPNPHFVPPPTKKPIRKRTVTYDNGTGDIDIKWEDASLEEISEFRSEAACHSESYLSSKCAYCGCTNDHIYGTCDYCGAPLEG